MVIIDTETGGRDPRRHALLSIAALHVETGAEFYRLVKPFPSYEIEDEATAVNGLTAEYLADAGSEEAEVIVAFAEWMAPYRTQDWGGCNPGYDRDFLHAAMERHGMEFRLPRRPVSVETVAWMADRLGVIELPTSGDGRKSASLDSILLTLHTRRITPIHNSLNDCYDTAKALHKLLALMGRKEAA